MKVNSGKDVAEEYRSSLSDLTINSKPLINMLTMLAEDYIEHAPVIVKVVELHLHKVSSDIKLPVLYLIDSIVKNVGKTYIHLFTQNIVSTFCAVFEKVDEKVRSQMFKLRQTWNDVFPAKKLFALDVRVHSIDPAWPITAAHTAGVGVAQTQAVRIHVNPKFLQGHTSSTSQSSLLTSSDTSQPISDGMMREELLKQQKELLELQKRKVELELLQTKAILEEQQKKLENQTASFISDTTLNMAPSDSFRNEFVTDVDMPAYPNSQSSTDVSFKSSGGSSFRTRDPRMKYNKDKSSDGRNKSSLLQKNTNQSQKQDGRISKKDKKLYKRHKERHASAITSTQLRHQPSVVCEWSIGDTSEFIGASASSKKRTGRNDRDLPVKLQEDNLPQPSVEHVSCSVYTISIDHDEDTSDAHHIQKKRYISAPEPNTSELNKNDPASISTIVVSRSNSSNENDRETNLPESINTEANINSVSSIGGIKRSLSKSPTPPSSKYTENIITNTDIDPGEPPKKKLTIDTRISPSRCEDDVGDTNKDVDLRQLPSPNKALTDDSHSTNTTSKISRAEMLDTLFGEEDVDLRTLPPIVRSPGDSSPLPDNIHTDVADKQFTPSSSPNQSLSPRIDERTPERPEYKAGNSDSPTTSRPTSPETSFSYQSGPVSDKSPLNTVTSVSSMATFTSTDASPITPPSISPLTSFVTSDIPTRVSHQLPPPFLTTNSIGQIAQNTDNDNAPDTSKTTPCSNVSSSTASTSVMIKPPLGITPLNEIKHTLGNILGLPQSRTTPSPPPPPMISTDAKDDAAEESSWANYKRIKGEEIGNKTPDLVRRSSTSRKDRTPSSIFKLSGVAEEKDSDQEMEERSSENCNIIIKEAEQQLSNGNITFSQYNRMLKEVITINEKRKLQEALRKDESDEQEQLEPEETVVVEPVDHKSTEEKEEDDEDRQTETDSDHQSQEAVTNEKCDTESTVNPQNHDIRKGGDFHLKGRNRPYYPKDGPSRFANHGRPGRSGPQKQMWENRNNTPSNLAAPLIKGQRSNWLYMRGPPPPQIQPPPLPITAQLTPRCNVSNFPVWMTPSGPGPSSLYYDSSTSKPPSYRYGPPPNAQTKKLFKPRHLPRRPEIPPADPLVLEMIEKDRVRPIMIDGSIREVCYYGETAIVMVAWDDPREVTFQTGSRMLVVDDHEQFVLHFNTPYRECVIDGHIFKVRLGAPTRELFIDGLYYELSFGGSSIKIMLTGKLRTIKLTGPTPKVRLGDVPRTELVAGKINLIVDAKKMFPIYLDAKPQRFEVGGVPYIFRFVEALQTVVINGVPFKFEFGGVPVPIYFHGEKHFLRLSVLPQNIRPGYVTIINMEGGRLPSPAPPEVNVQQPLGPAYSTSSAGTLYKSDIGNDHQLELLTSLMPTSMAPLAVPSYSVEHNPVNSNPPPVGQAFGNINIGELYQKLVATGIVPPIGQFESSSADDSTTIKTVDFSKPETLKVKQPGLISRLYSGIQCSSCGVRFSPEQTVKYSQHLDWHFRQNRREKMSARIARSRRWNYDVSDWIQFQEIEDLDDRVASWFEMQEKNRSKDEEPDSVEQPSVAALVGVQEDEFCLVCHDEFDIFYNEEKEEWHWRKAVRVEGHLYHPLCYQELLEHRARIDQPEITSFEEEEPIVIDDSDPNSSINLEEDVKLEDNNKIEEITLDDSIKDTEQEVCKIVDDDDDIKMTEDTSKAIEIDLLDVDKEEEKVNNTDDDGDIEIVEVSTNHDPDINIGKNLNFDDKEVSSTNVLDESDDDILQIEIVERKIESVEITDDEDEGGEAENKSSSNKNNICTTDKSNKEEEPTSSEDEEEEMIDFSKVKVKTEKIDLALPDPVTIPSHVTVVSTIDGNVELDEATPVVVPRNKIKINISSKHIQNFPRALPSESTINDNMKEPPPPGEELVPATLKPSLVGLKMEVREPVTKGSEVSGLCSVM